MQRLILRYVDIVYRANQMYNGTLLFKLNLVSVHRNKVGKHLSMRKLQLIKIQSKSLEISTKIFIENYII